MGKRGPQPGGKLSVVEVQVKQRPNPPAGMTKRARNLFKKIVAENKPDAFDAESIALLRAFCEADRQNFVATNKLKKEDAVILVATKQGTVPRKNPWFDIQKESAALMSSLSTKLRMKGVNIDNQDMKPQSKRSGLMWGS